MVVLKEVNYQGRSTRCVDSASLSRLALEAERRRDYANADFLYRAAGDEESSLRCSYFHNPRKLQPSRRTVLE